ncbi:hypothetical protein, partial [Shewanella sp. GutDb-MelDb]|uniref:hypothetical protein n=1 Tax=Shewanella sp. GutDb-MelDb TaxID=2058316 RepID=UPI001C60E16E
QNNYSRLPNFERYKIEHRKILNEIYINSLKESIADLKSLCFIKNNHNKTKCIAHKIKGYSLIANCDSLSNYSERLEYVLDNNHDLICLEFAKNNLINQLNECLYIITSEDENDSQTL